MSGYLLYVCNLLLNSVKRFWVPHLYLHYILEVTYKYNLHIQASFIQINLRKANNKKRATLEDRRKYEEKARKGKGRRHSIPHAFDSLPNR